MTDNKDKDVLKGPPKWTCGKCGSPLMKVKDGGVHYWCPVCKKRKL